MPDVEVRHEPEEDRFLALLDAQPAGFLAYSLEEGLYDLQHTVVRPDFRGRGVASTLIAQVLAAVRAEGKQVLPSCPFVRGYLQEHPDDGDLVPAVFRAEFGLERPGP